MKTKSLFTSLAAAVMLSAGLAGAGMSVAEPVHAATTQTSNQKGTISIKRRSVSATVNNANPKLYAVNQDGKIVKSMDSNYTKVKLSNFTSLTKLRTIKVLLLSIMLTVKL